MDLEVSQKTQKLCKSLKLTAEQMAFADLLAVGWEPTDAYIVAFHQGSTWVKAALKREVEKLVNNENVKNRVDETRSVLSARQKESIAKASSKEASKVVEAAMSKETMLYELQMAKNEKVKGSKEWIDINKMIIDVTRMKRDDVQTENTTIHHFLPVRYPTGCQDCLYSRCDRCKYKLAYKDEVEF